MNQLFKIKKTALTLVMFLFGLAFLLPFFWMLSASFKPEVDVFNYPIEWIPSTWHAIENYREVWFGKRPFHLYYWNSIQVTLLTTLFSVLFSAMAAYGFSKIYFKGRDVIFMLVLITYMIPPQVIIVPQFLWFRELNLFDTHLALIFINGFSVIGTFLLRQFFLGVSNEYLEAAKIDGAGHVKIFSMIAFPLIRPVVATYVILKFIWTWNDYQTPFIFLRSDSLFTLQLAIAKFSDLNGEFYSLMMAGTVSAIVPLFIVFVLAQKHVIEGVSLGGVKG